MATNDWIIRQREADVAHYREAIEQFESGTKVQKDTGGGWIDITEQELAYARRKLSEANEQIAHLKAQDESISSHPAA